MSGSISWDIGLATVSSYKDGAHLGIQVDGYGEDQAAMPEGFCAELGGIMCRPDDPALDPEGQPIPDKATQVMYGWEGGRQFVVPMNDPRVTAKSPQLTKGGKQIVVKSGAFSQWDGDTGSFTTYVPYDFPGDDVSKTANKACLFAIDTRAKGSETIQIVHGCGTAFVMMGDGTITIKNKAGDACYVLDSTGHLLNGNTKIYGGLHIGSPAAMPIALAPGVQAQIATIQTQMTAISVALGLIAAAFGPTGFANEPTMKAYLLGDAIAQALVNAAFGAGTAAAGVITAGAAAVAAGVVPATSTKTVSD